jgi:hypothetical protein
VPRCLSHVPRSFCAGACHVPQIEEAFGIGLRGKRFPPSGAQGVLIVHPRGSGTEAIRDRSADRQPGPERTEGFPRGREGLPGLPFGSKARSQSR